MKMADCPVSVKNTFWQDNKRGDRMFGITEGLTKTNVFVEDSNHNKAVHKKMKQIWHITKKENK